MALKARLAGNPLDWGLFHYPDVLTDRAAPFQAAICRTPAPGAREAITTFRGGAKTSLLQILLAHGLCYRQPWVRHVLYISASDSLAVEKTVDIAESLTAPSVVEHFGQPFTSADVQTRGEFVTTWGQRVLAMGLGAKFRGRLWRGIRPTAAILDDIESGREETSSADRRRAREWFTRKLANSLSPDGVILAIGNRVHEDGLMAWLLRNPEFRSRVVPAVTRWPTKTELWEECRRIFVVLEDVDRVKHATEFYEAHRAEMSDGVLAWPARLDWLRDVYRRRWSIGDGAFNAEMQCDASGAQSGTIDPARMRWCAWANAELQSDDGHSASRDGMSYVGFWDPAGGTGDGDYSAIVTLGIDRWGYAHMVEALMSQSRAPSQQAADAHDAAARWGWQYAGIEDDTFKAMMAAWRSEQAAREAAGVQVRTVALGIRQRRKKEHRLVGLEPLISNGWLRFDRAACPEELRVQLYAIPHGAHDDGPDAIEGALQVARKVGLTS